MRTSVLRLTAGLVLVLAAVVIDPLRGRPLALGAVQLAMLASGALLALSAVPVRSRRLRRALAGALVAVGATYAALVALELALGLVSPPRATRNALVDLRGMTIEDPAVGFRLAERWHGRYDDGVVAADYDTNARGDRDDDGPLPGARRRVLLLGDSFTFGQALPRAHTIEAAIEAGSDGEVEAYDLGVPGYSAMHALRRFEQSAWWSGGDVVYMFFNNDVHPGNQALDYVRVVDGYAVPRRRPDGTAYDDAELRARLGAALGSDPGSPWAWLAERVALRRLRQLVAGVRDPELRRTGLPAEAFDPRVVDAVVEQVRAMEALAIRRGARFHLVVIPTMVEVAEGSWSRSTASFIGAARAAGLVPNEDLLERLDMDDYLVHDGHFARSGASEAALLVLGCLGQNPA